MVVKPKIICFVDFGISDFPPDGTDPNPNFSCYFLKNQKKSFLHIMLVLFVHILYMQESLNI
jgi:hypothetical protein